MNPQENENGWKTYVKDQRKRIDFEEGLDGRAVPWVSWIFVGTSVFFGMLAFLALIFVLPSPSGPFLPPFTVAISATLVAFSGGFCLPVTRGYRAEARAMRDLLDLAEIMIHLAETSSYDLVRKRLDSILQRRWTIPMNYRYSVLNVRSLILADLFSVAFSFLSLFTGDVQKWMSSLAWASIVTGYALVAFWFIPVLFWELRTPRSE